MKKFLIATHGELSRELVDTSKLIIGSLANIEYFCMTKDKSADDAEKEIRSILSNNKDSEEFVVLTDVFGGSVANICTNLLLQGFKFELLTGVNLPMLLSIFLLVEEDTKLIVKSGLEEAKNGIVYVNELLENRNKIKNVM
ncbi:PTS system mannose/fructose/sorbose transporter subunit IIA [Clostridioides difficile]|uniref:PTS system, IIa component n=3 Tax=Clostridioides difficile TaxID=1496 RepID=A0A9R0CFY0_CLODR|nr:PTS mannose transporter subunit IIA [Clostridioides difficile]OFU03636.1 PTS mannose transporter subunit IIA [Clostridium sp. HMSC19E03]OFU17039.1 PTS mannose transporter subunit IIA [Clostridium sp. HMSC19C05]OFU19885.1 PTS mannose transporter subunit IIA [Clostridium sp. HMSC19C09]OFU24347.1 PTS mannose transporter subunit IIA [Clostridium sp. HMSC19C08]OFU30683.1 PTS mannose transporter subunit IIA [Clostridium sp. HMSC19B10]OFU42925.1 PTS mannose transporter subunit IIA [Clostridium sp